MSRDVDTLEATVRDLKRGIAADLIAVKGHLDRPYPDDPRWTPWTRFVERALRHLTELDDSLRDLAAIARDGQEALEYALANMPGHSHWREGGSGGRCEACERYSRVAERARAALVSVPAGQETERCSASCPANTCFEIHGPHRCSLEGGHGGGHSFWCQRFEPSR